MSSRSAPAAAAATRGHHLRDVPRDAPSTPRTRRAATSSSSADGSGTGDSLSVVSWNTEHKESLSHSSLAPVFNAFRAATGAGVILVQEPSPSLRRASGRSGSRNPWEVVSEFETAGRERIGAGANHDEKNTDAVVVVHQEEKKRFHMRFSAVRPSRGTNTGRHAIRADFTHKDTGATFQLATAHAPYQGATASTSFFSGTLAANPDADAVMGDLNLYSHHRRDRALADLQPVPHGPTSNYGQGSPLDQTYARRSPRGHGRLYPSARPPRELGQHGHDIPISGAAANRVAEPDHLPIYAQFSLRAPAAPAAPPSRRRRAPSSSSSSSSARKRVKKNDGDE